MIVAPHPDDEVIGCGGLLWWCAAERRPATIVAVTDGEASHARSMLITPAELRLRRVTERAEALRHLGASATTIVRLGAPDGACREHVASIADRLHEMLRPGDVVVGPSNEDRHSDHVAVSDALRAAAGGLVDHVWEAPTWALVHGTAPAPDRRLTLGANAWRAKRRAFAAHRSQVVPIGPAIEDGPVVHPAEVATMIRPVEGFRAVAVA